MLQCFVCSPIPKVSEKKGNRSEFHSKRNYYLQNWYFRCIRAFMSNLIKKSWKDSNLPLCCTAVEIGEATRPEVTRRRPSNIFFILLSFRSIHEGRSLCNRLQSYRDLFFDILHQCAPEKKTSCLMVGGDSDFEIRLCFFAWPRGGHDRD